MAEREKLLPLTAVDADTVDSNERRYRLSGIDAPESATAPGRRATERTRELLASERFEPVTRGTGYFGRDVADFVNRSGGSLNETLVAEGQAVPRDYNDTGKRRYALAGLFNTLNEAPQGSTLPPFEGPEALQNPKDPTERYDRSLTQELGAGVRRGVDIAQAGVGGALSLAGSVFNEENSLSKKPEELGWLEGVGNWLQRKGERIYMRNMEQAEDNPASETFREALQGEGNLLRWGFGAIGEAAPSMLALAAGGGAGGAIGAIAKRTAGKALFRAARVNLRKLGVPRSRAHKYAKAFVQNLPLHAARAGAFTVSAGMEGGHIFEEIKNEFGKQATGTALTAGAIAGALDVVGAEALLRQIDISGGEGKRLMTELLARAGIGFVSEGTTEALQESINVIAKEVENPDKSKPLADRVLTEDNVWQVAGAAAAGALFGGVAGTVAGGVNVAAERLRNREAPPDDTTQDTTPPGGTTIEGTLVDPPDTAPPSSDGTPPPPSSDGTPPPPGGTAPEEQGFVDEVVSLADEFRALGGEMTDEQAAQVERLARDNFRNGNADRYRRQMQRVVNLQKQENHLIEQAIQANTRGIPNEEIATEVKRRIQANENVQEYIDFLGREASDDGSGGAGEDGAGGAPDGSGESPDTPGPSTPGGVDELSDDGSESGNPPGQPTPTPGSDPGGADGSPPPGRRLPESSGRAGESAAGTAVAGDETVAFPSVNLFENPGIAQQLAQIEVDVRPVEQMPPRIRAREEAYREVLNKYLTPSDITAALAQNETDPLDFLNRLMTERSGGMYLQEWQDLQRSKPAGKDAAPSEGGSFVDLEWQALRNTPEAVQAIQDGDAESAAGLAGVSLATAEEALRVMQDRQNFLGREQGSAPDLLTGDQTGLPPERPSRSAREEAAAQATARRAEIQSELAGIEQEIEALSEIKSVVERRDKRKALAERRKDAQKRAAEIDKIYDEVAPRPEGRAPGTGTGFQGDPDAKAPAQRRTIQRTEYREAVEEAVEAPDADVEAALSVVDNLRGGDTLRPIAVRQALQGNNLMQRSRAALDKLVDLRVLSPLSQTEFMVNPGYAKRRGRISKALMRNDKLRDLLARKPEIMPLLTLAYQVFSRAIPGPEGLSRETLERAAGMRPLLDETIGVLYNRRVGNLKDDLERLGSEVDEWFREAGQLEISEQEAIYDAQLSVTDARDVVVKTGVRGDQAFGRLFVKDSLPQQFLSGLLEILQSPKRGTTRRVERYIQKFFDDHPDLSDNEAGALAVLADVVPQQGSFEAVELINAAGDLIDPQLKARYETLQVVRNASGLDPAPVWLEFDRSAKTVKRGGVRGGFWLAEYYNGHEARSATALMRDPDRGGYIPVADFLQRSIERMQRNEMKYSRERRGLWFEQGGKRIFVLAHAITKLGMDMDPGNFPHLRDMTSSDAWRAFQAGLSAMMDAPVPAYLSQTQEGYSLGSSAFEANGNMDNVVIRQAYQGSDIDYNLSLTMGQARKGGYGTRMLREFDSYRVVQQENLLLDDALSDPQRSLETLRQFYERILGVVTAYQPKNVSPQLVEDWISYIDNRAENALKRARVQYRDRSDVLTELRDLTPAEFTLWNAKRKRTAAFKKKDRAKTREQRIAAFAEIKKTAADVRAIEKGLILRKYRERLENLENTNDRQAFLEGLMDENRQRLETFENADAYRMFGDIRDNYDPFTNPDAVFFSDPLAQVELEDLSYWLDESEVYADKADKTPPSREALQYEARQRQQEVRGNPTEGTITSRMEQAGNVVIHDNPDPLRPEQERTDAFMKQGPREASGDGAFIKGAFDLLGLQGMNITVLRPAEFWRYIEERFPNVPDDVRQEMQRTSWEKAGVFLFGKDAVFFVDPALTPNQRSLALGHEIGHVVLRAYIENMPAEVKAQLEAAHQRSGSDRSFPEWFADEVAISLHDRKKPKTTAERIKRVFTRHISALVDYLAPEGRNITVEAFMEGLILKENAKALRETEGTIAEQAALLDALFSKKPTVDFLSMAGVPRLSARWYNQIAGSYPAVGRVLRSIAAAGKVAKDVGSWFHDRWVRTSDGWLRSRGFEETTVFADIYSARAGMPRNAGPRTIELNLGQGMVDTVTIDVPQEPIFEAVRRQEGRWWFHRHGRNRSMNELTQLIDDLPEAEHDQVMLELQAEMDTTNPLVIELRQNLRDFYDYAKTVMRNLGDRGENYFPHVYDHSKIRENYDAWIDFLMAHTQFHERDAAEQFTNEILTEPVYEVLESSPPPGSPFSRGRVLEIDDTNAAAKRMHASFMPDNMRSIIHTYLNRMLHKREYEKAFGDYHDGPQGQFWVPDSKFQRLFASLKERMEGNEPREFYKIHEAYLGRLGADMPMGLRLASSVAVTYQNIRLLPMVVLSSFVDPANVLIRSDAGVKNGLKGLGDAIKELRNKGLLWEAARINQIVADGTVNEVVMEKINLPYMTEGLHRFNERFFRWVGLQWWTNTMRLFALATSRYYIKDLAAKGDARKLEELGLTIDEANQWDGTFEPLPDPHSVNEKALIAGNRFVYQSVFAPDASQRPARFSSPYLMVIWHLKSFMWSFGSLLLGRTWREIKQADTFTQKAMLAAIPFMFMLPLAIFATAVRDALKHEEVVPWREYEPKELNWMETALRGVERAGVLGPMQLIWDADQVSEWNKLFFLSFLGPSISHAEDLLIQPFDRWAVGAVPGLSVLPAEREAVRDWLGGG